MTYSRPWLSYEQQLQQLKDRGMEVSDDAAALRYLERIGYYRLSAYWYPFRQKEFDSASRVTRVKDEFIPNTELRDAVKLYLFDKKLRLILLDALERIEIALRVDISHLLGRLDTFAHTHSGKLHKSFANKVKESGKPTAFNLWNHKRISVEARSKEDFVSHYKEKHGPDLPIWVAVETWDFGALSQLFAMMKVKHQTQVALKYGIADWEAFQSWLRSLTYLRNICAHHSRLWNRNIIDQPSLPDAGALIWLDKLRGGNFSEDELKSRPFLLIAICRHMVLQLNPLSNWHRRVQEHLDQFPTIASDYQISTEAIGAPRDWKSWW